MPITLNKPFAPDTSVDPWDVQQIKKALNRIGCYQPLEKTGITAIPDRAVFDGIKMFQQQWGLKVTSQIRPGDETEKLLRAEADKTPSGSYVWRTVEDGKVRQNHAQYNRTIRSWADRPDPGEDYNCRCWAEPVKDSILKGVDDIEIVKFLISEEKNIEYMYRDTKGHVTVGIGIMLPNAEAAKKLQFDVLDPKAVNGKRSATQTEIENAYQKVKNQPFGQNLGAANYEPSPKNNLDHLSLNEKTAINVSKEHLRKDADSLRCKFPGFDRFPTDAQKALLDMEYNMGGKLTPHRIENGREAGWPNFFKAIKAQEWHAAAKESHRKDVSESRNQRTRVLFKDAAKKNNGH